MSLTHTWSTLHPKTPDASVNWYIASDSDGSNLIAGTLSAGYYVYTSIDSGANWTERRPGGDAISGFFNLTVSDADGSVLIACKYGARSYISVDSGVSWAEIRPKGDVNVTWGNCAIDASGQNIVIGQENGRLYISHDTGASWAEIQPAGVANKQWAIITISQDGSIITVAAYSGRYYISTDGGDTWEQKYPAGVANNSWTCGASSLDGSVLIAADVARIFISINLGIDWTEASQSGYYFYSNCCACSSDGKYIVLGSSTDGVYGGDLFFSSDYGATWEELSPVGNPTTKLQYVSVKMNTAGTKIIVATWPLLTETTYCYLDNISNPDDGDVITLACGYAGQVRNNIPDLSHLEGQTVAVVANGKFLGERVVSGGIVDLLADGSYSVAYAGLPYECDLETLNIEVPLDEGTLQHRRVKVGNVKISLMESRGGYIGPDEDSLWEAITPEFIRQHSGQNIGDNDLFTGDIRQPLGSQFGDGGRFFFRQTDPLPVTITSIIPEVAVGGPSR